MVKMVSIEVLVVFVIIFFIIGALLGIILMCALIVGGDSDRKGEHDESDTKRE